MTKIKKYKYVWSEYTLVKVLKNWWHKLKVEAWQTFESEVYYRWYPIVSVEEKTEVDLKLPKEEVKETKKETTEVSNPTADLLEELRQEYKNKFGNEVSNRYKNNISRIKSKLAK